MSRAPLKRRVEVTPPKESAALPRPPTREEFEAECEALTTAVVQTLQTDLRTKIAKPAAKEVAAAVPWHGGDGTRVVDPQPVHYPGIIDFVPPYSFIMANAGADASSGNDGEDVIISRQLLEFLLRCVLNHIDFDERQYQLCNPDVAIAIRQRKIPSGREHFIKSGYFEGRSGGVSVDEAWYLGRNPDVAAAKRAGKFESGATQYRLAGASEWRVPNPQAEDAIRVWKNVLQRR